MAVRDPHSFSRADEALVRHLDLDLTVDFAARVLRGRASWKIEVAAGGRQLVLDTRDLKIERVTATRDPASPNAGATPANHALATAQGDFGSALAIDVASDTKWVTI